MSSTYGERRESSCRYGCPTVLPKPSILQQVDTNIAVPPCQTYLGGSLSPYKQGQYPNGQGHQISSPFKKITGLKKTPHKKTQSTLSAALDSSYAEGGSENYYVDSQETTLSTTDASFAQFLHQQQSRQRQFNGSEGQNMNLQLQQQLSQRKQRQTASLYAQAPVIQKITGIPYVSYRQYPQHQQISSETHLFDSGYASPLSVSNKTQPQSIYDQQHMFQQQRQQQQQQQYFQDQQPGRQQVHHHQAAQYQADVSYHSQNNQFQLGRNQSDGSLITFNGYENQSDEQLSPLNNSRNSNESEGSDNLEAQHIHLGLKQQQQQKQLQQKEVDTLGQFSQRSKRNHSMYAPQSDYNLDYAGINLAQSNNSAGTHQQFYPLYKSKSPNSGKQAYNNCQSNNQYHPNGAKSFQNLQNQQNQNLQQQQFFTGQPCYSHCTQQSNPICFQQYQSNPIPSSPIRTAFVQASNQCKNNHSPIHLPLKPANPYSPNLYEVFGQHANNSLTPSNHQTGLFSQCVTGSTVVHQSSGGSMCQSSVLQNSSFLNNIPPQDNESSKNSSVLQIGSNFGSIKQNKSGFLNTQSSFINGFVRQSPPQIGLFQKCPQLQKIIDDLKDNIVKDLEILSDKLQKESEAIYYSQQNYHSKQQQHQQQEQLQEQQLHGGVDLGEYSLGEDKKVRFSFSGTEVIAQISATNNKLNNKISSQNKNVLSTFATPIFQTSILSPMQQQIIASEIIANLPYDRLPESQALSTPRNPLESDTSSYLPTFSSPQRDADQNRHRNGSISSEIVQNENTRKEAEVQDKLFEQFFKSQNEVVEEEEKKDEEMEQRVNSLEEGHRLNSAKSKGSEESETALGKLTPQFESSKTKNCHQNAVTLNSTNSNKRACSSLNSQEAEEPSQSSNNGRNSPQIEEFTNDVQSIAQNLISPGGLKNEILLSDHDDVVLRTDNTDQTSESSPKFTRLWDKNMIKAPFPIQFFQGKVPAGFANPSSALDDIKEQQEIESADSTPKTQPQPIASGKNLSIQTSLPEINLESDSHLNEASSKTQIQQDACPVYRGSTKSNSSSSSSSGACRRYQDFSMAAQKQKIESSRSQLSNNSSAGNNVNSNNLHNPTELNYSSISSNTPRSSRYALTQKLQSYSSLKSSGNSQLSSSNNQTSSNRSLGEKVLQEKNTTQQGEKQSDKEVNLLPFRTAPCSPAYTPLVRFSTYLKQHQGEQSLTQGMNSLDNKNKFEEKVTIIERKADDKNEYKNRESDKGFFASILKRNHSIVPMPVEIAGNKALLYKSKSQSTLFSNDLSGNQRKPEVQADILVSKDNPLEQIRDYAPSQETYTDNATNQFQNFLNPPSVPASASKNEQLSNKLSTSQKSHHINANGSDSNRDSTVLSAFTQCAQKIPNIYESTQKFMKDSEITSKIKFNETSTVQSKQKALSSENQEEEMIMCSEKKDSNEDLVLNSDDNQQLNSQTIMAECTPEKVKIPNDCENLNTNKHGEDSSKEHKIFSLPPKAPRVAISDKENVKQQQQQQQFTQQCSSQSGGSSSKKKLKFSLELTAEDGPLNNSEQNTKKQSFVFSFDQPKDVRRNLSSELNSELDSNKQASPQRVMTPSRKREEQIHKLRKDTSLEKDIQGSSSSNNNDNAVLCQGLLNSSESASLLNIPQSESDPSFSKSQNHLLVRDKIQLAEGEEDTPPCEITISISNKSSLMNQSKTILKKSLIGSPTSSSRLNPGNSVKKSQRRISFKDNLEEVNYFEPEGKSLSTRSPNSKILLPRMKSRPEFKKEPYYNPIKKFPGIQNHPTLLQQYSSSESSNLNVAVSDDKSPSKTIQEELTPRKNISTHNNSIQEQKKTPLELGKNNDFKIPQLNALNNITPTKQALFKPLNFTPSGGSGKSSKQTKLSFLEYSKIAKQQDQK